MSVIQQEELVSYQLRTSYLNEIADGVGERLLTINEGFVNSAAFKAAGWRPNSSHIKRTHSPPIPTAIASEYFQAPRHHAHTLEDREEEDGGMLTGGGADTVGPSAAATKRRRRREQMEEDDSSDLSDESDEDNDQRAAQQIKFAKMPVRHRSGSSPTQNSSLPKTAPSPRSGRAGQRRGSQPALEVVKERARRDTVTSSEVSSDNELEMIQKQRSASRAAARAARLQDKIHEEPTPGIQRQGTHLLPEEEEDSDDVSEMSDYVGSLDSASILDVADMPVNTSITAQVVGTPPRHLTRRSTVRKSQAPIIPVVLEALPPPRPMTLLRPMSVVQPKSLLSAALKAKEHKSKVPFQKFAHYSGQGTRGSIAVRIYPAFSAHPEKPYEVLIQPRVHDGQGAERTVTVADLIGLSLYRYNAEKRAPDLPAGKLNINWWTLRMVEEGGEVDDDFPPFERTKPLSSFATNNNATQRGGGRARANSTAYDEFALVAASEEEYLENKDLTPQEEEDEEESVPETPRPEAYPKTTPWASNPNTVLEEETRPRLNPIITTTYRSHKPNTPLADAPQAPVSTVNRSQGQQKLLRIHIMSSDAAAAQMVTVDVTTDTYLAEVLEVVCRKRQLDKGNHVLKLPGSGAIVMIDRPVSSIGNVSDLELYRRRFATDGPTMTGSPSSASPKAALADAYAKQKVKKTMLGPHPLAREIAKQDELRSANYKKYTVWRKQPMRIVGMSERILVIDGEYIHVIPASGGKALHDGGGKTTTVHFSNVVGCKVPRKHPTNVKLVVYKATESKRYDFETRGADEAAEIVAALKKGISPYREV